MHKLCMCIQRESEIVEEKFGQMLLYKYVCMHIDIHYNNVLLVFEARQQCSAIYNNSYRLKVPYCTPGRVVYLYVIQSFHAQIEWSFIIIHIACHCTVYYINKFNIDFHDHLVTNYLYYSSHSVAITTM